MASGLYTLLAQSLGDENKYLSESPYIAGAKSIMGADIPRARTNVEAIAIPIVQQIAAGLMAGYGKQSATEKAYDDYRTNPLLASMTEANIPSMPETSGIGPVADSETYQSALAHSLYAGEDAPDGWTPAQGRTDLLKALITQESQQEIAQKRAEREFALTNQLAGKQMQLNPATGKIELIPGAADTIAQIEGAKATAKEAAKTKDGKKPSYWDAIPAADQSAIAGANGVIKTAEKLANDFAEFGGDALSFKAAAQIAGSEAAQLKDRAATMGRSMARLVDKGTLSDEDNKVWTDVLQGKWNSSPKDIARAIKNANEQLRDVTAGKLEGFKDAFEKGPDALLADLKQGNRNISTPASRPIIDRAAAIAELKRRGRL